MGWLFLLFAFGVALANKGKRHKLVGESLFFFFFKHGAMRIFQMKKQIESNKTPGNRKGEGEMEMWAGKKCALPSLCVVCLLVSVCLIVGVQRLGKQAAASLGKVRVVRLQSALFFKQSFQIVNQAP